MRVEWKALFIAMALWIAIGWVLMIFLIAAIVEAIKERKKYLSKSITPITEIVYSMQISSIRDKSFGTFYNIDAKTTMETFRETNNF